VAQASLIRRVVIVAAGGEKRGAELMLNDGIFTKKIVFVGRMRDITADNQVKRMCAGVLCTSRQGRFKE